MEGEGGYLIEVQGGVIAEGTNGGQLHQPIILPCPDWLIILQAGSRAGREGGRDKWRRTGNEMERKQRSTVGETAANSERRWDREQGQGRKKRERKMKREGGPQGERRGVWRAVRSRGEDRRRRGKTEDLHLSFWSISGTSDRELVQDAGVPIHPVDDKHLRAEGEGVCLET